MNFRNFLRTLAVACTFAVASTASATATLQVDGALYNVTFLDGSCPSLFNGCVASAFAFNSSTTAVDAGQALLDQVSVDGPAGNFSSSSNLTLGCSYMPSCNVIIPYRLSSALGISIAYSNNNSGTVSDNVYLIPNLLATYDTSENNAYTYAIFEIASPTTAVPEPSSLALMGLSLAALAFARRRKA